MPSIAFGSYDLTSLVESDDLAENSRLSMGTAPRRHGAVLTEEAVLEPLEWTVRGRYVGTSEADARSALDDMLKALNESPPQNFTYYSGRYCSAYKRNFHRNFIDGTALSAWSFEIDFVAPIPFWISTTQTNLSQAVTYNPTSWVHANAGSAFVFPAWTITADGGNISNFTITNSTTGKSFTFTGTVLSGQSLVVNAAALTAKNNGVDALNNMTGTLWLWLATGDNTIQYAGGNATINLTYLPRYWAP